MQSFFQALLSHSEKNELFPSHRAEKVRLIFLQASVATWAVTTSEIFILLRRTRIRWSTYLFPINIFYSVSISSRSSIFKINLRFKFPKSKLRSLICICKLSISHFLSSECSCSANSSKYLGWTELCDPTQICFCSCLLDPNREVLFYLPQSQPKGSSELSMFWLDVSGVKWPS